MIQSPAPMRHCCTVIRPPCSAPAQLSELPCTHSLYLAALNSFVCKLAAAHLPHLSTDDEEWRQALLSAYTCYVAHEPHGQEQSSCFLSCVQNKTVANRDALKQMTKCLALYEVMKQQESHELHTLCSPSKPHGSALLMGSPAAAVHDQACH